VRSTDHDRPVSTDATRRAIEAASAGFPLDDVDDFDDTERGFVGRSEQRQIVADDGHVVWDLDAYRFLEEPVPDTANPSLWRQGQLLIRDGLFEVVPGVYQVRGYDLSVMSLIEGDTRCDRHRSVDVERDGGGCVCFVPPASW
jgi:alkyl sulfatase BDS1-like metallo-beta-lactamase superfamily hydrolase